MSNPPNPKKNNPFSSPVGTQQPNWAPGHPHGQQGDATGGVIPYKNPQALVAYYLGIVALLPVIGLPFGIASLVLGILGLRARKRNPVIKGSAHAIIGICGGVFSLLCGGTVLFFMIMSFVDG